jgi:hypothetical protein
MALDNRAFTFDAAMISIGLLRLYEEIPDPSLIKSVKSTAEWILSLQNEDGSIVPVFPAGDSRRWSQSRGAHHGKIAIMLLEFYRATGESEYFDSALKLLSWVRSIQGASGWFATPNGDVYVHPHCYACEGLLYAGLTLHRNDLLSAAKLGIKVLKGIRSRTGDIPRWAIDGQEFGSDVLAQAIRLWLINLDETSEVRQSLERLRTWIIYKGERAIKGGMPYSSIVRHVNSWAAMFSLQALIFEELRKQEEPAALVRSLF